MGREEGRRLWLGIWILLLLLLWGGDGARSARAEDPRVGIWVRFPDGREVSACLPLPPEGELRGVDLLKALGVPLSLQESPGLGAAVCAIDGEGCLYPAEDCFCRCSGGADCAYWRYFLRGPKDSEWVYAPVGASQRRLGPGDLDAWVWGGEAATPPPEVTFETVCEAPSPTPEAVPPAPSSLSTPAATPPSAPASPPRGGEEGDPPWRAYLAFLGLLGGAGAWRWWRRRGEG